MKLKYDANLEELEKVIKGDVMALPEAFTWGLTPQGHYYWFLQLDEEEPLDIEALKEIRREVLEDMQSRATEGSAKSSGVDHPSQNTGGPATYYDLPFWEWKTLNDMLEHLAVKQWGAYSLHFKDMAKALVRFGVKTGTSKEYDIEKMIYSGCRAMVMLSGKDSLREYLKRLLDDPQFK